MTQMLYESTRSNGEKTTFSQAVLKGLAPDGGLYVPINFPKIDKSFEELMDYDYKDLAKYIMGKYFTDFDKKSLEDCVENAYDEKFDTKEIAPIVQKEGVYFLELYHGPTLAFKDMALSILPRLLKTAATSLKVDKEIVILAATSGDTGKAALEGFANVEGTRIIVFFPQDGVSEVQKMQMITQEGENTYVVGINGNFDDAQRAVKEAFSDGEFNKELEEDGFIFSSANSINIGRLVPQIVYYIYSYVKLLKDRKIKENEKINIVVPTGNFGNILAAYYGKQMGLPINKLICASNVNNVLYDFIDTGIYDRNRKFKKTISPSMDILISSNLERLLYELSGRDYGFINDLMEQLSKEGKYEISDNMKKGLEDFYGGYTSDEETLDTVKKVYEESNYLIDTHTAVAYSVYEKYREETNDETATIIASTASPFKFTRSVMNALYPEYKEKSDFELVNIMAERTDTDIPKAIKDLDKKKVLHKDVCESSEIKSVISKYLRK